MAANPNWARWIYAGLADYLKKVAVDIPVPCLIEGTTVRTDDILKQPEHVEVAITGPFTREPTRHYFVLKVGVRVLIHSRMDKGTNRYSPQRIAGVYQEAMDAVIAIYRSGDGKDDDQTLLGCLSVLNGQGEGVRVMHFGQASATDSLRQSMVDCWYQMEIQTDDE